jgi:hypothetical protein
VINVEWGVLWCGIPVCTCRVVLHVDPGLACYRDLDLGEIEMKVRVKVQPGYSSRPGWHGLLGYLVCDVHDVKQEGVADTLTQLILTAAVQ